MIADCELIYYDLNSFNIVYFIFLSVAFYELDSKLM